MKFSIKDSKMRNNACCPTLEDDSKGEGIGYFCTAVDVELTYKEVTQSSGINWWDISLKKLIIFHMF